jgi:hypothetical protein
VGSNLTDAVIVPDLSKRAGRPGLKNFGLLLNEAAQRAPIGELER